MRQVHADESHEINLETRCLFIHLKWGLYSCNQTLWISHPEHCLILVKGPVIRIISKSGIRRFLGKQWNQQKAEQL